MKVHVIEPKVYINQSILEGRIELARCAYKASLSRRKLRRFDVEGKIVGHREAEETEPFSKAEEFISRLLSFKPHPHESVLEHGHIGADFQLSRVITHQLVRHRLGAITQESTRYVPYHRDDDLYLIKPIGAPNRHLGTYDLPWSDKLLLDRLEDETEAPEWVIWAAQQCRRYKMLVEQKKWRKEDARYQLTHHTASWIAYTGNFRQWRHMVAHRDQKKASPEIQFVFKQIREYLGHISPVLLENLEHEND